jgi:pyruvate dehydrogenase E2 component (dihydrolipoamide acetyltransferase)
MCSTRSSARWENSAVASEVKLPRLGQGMEAGTITKWLKSEGETVAKGEPLFEIDTDKVTQEVESDFAGVLLKIALSEGEAPVGQTIAWIGEQGEAAPEADASAASKPPPEPKTVTSASAPAEAPAPAAVQAPANGGRIKASPLARRIARERGIDLAALRGTGPDGRIVAEDVERGATPEPQQVPTWHKPTGEVESVPLTRIRKTIARRLTAAWEAPVFQLTVSADMTRANELVARARELNPDVRITVTDLLAKVSAHALRRHPDVNVQYTEDALLKFPTANIGIAVAAPQGLVVPVLRSVERISLAEVAAVRSDVVGRARENKLTADDLEGGTFSISNLGMYGIEQFVAVLNPPQAAILAVGATLDTPVARGGGVEVRPIMSLTLTVDHRAVDGAAGADFLRTVKQFVEDPALAL